MTWGQSKLRQQPQNANKREMKCIVDLTETNANHVVRSNNHQSLCKRTISAESGRKPQKTPLKYSDANLNRNHTTNVRLNLSSLNLLMSVIELCNNLMPECLTGSGRSACGTARRITCHHYRCITKEKPVSHANHQQSINQSINKFISGSWPINRQTDRQTETDRQLQKLHKIQL